MIASQMNWPHAKTKNIFKKMWPLQLNLKASDTKFATILIDDNVNKLQQGLWMCLRSALV